MTDTAPLMGAPSEGKASVTLRDAACYTVRNGWAWAHLFVRAGQTGQGDEVSGWVHLSVISDYGSFGFCWSHIGAGPWQQFLAGLDKHYAMNKMLGDRYRVPLSGVEAEERARERVIDLRRNGGSREDARQLWEAIPDGADSGDAREFCRRWDCDSGGAFYRHELWDARWDKVNPQADGFWSDIWPLFIQAIHPDPQCVAHEATRAGNSGKNP